MQHANSTAMQERQQLALTLLRAAGILPILTVDSVNQARATAEALRRGGLNSIELTLRTAASLPALAALKREFPDMAVGAGTVLTADQVRAAEQAGADFLITPGVSRTMVDVLASTLLPVVPGIATPSELLTLHERGFRVAKLFPAAALGGIKMLKALHGPFPDMMFCPTGGIGENDAEDFLAQPNVACIGGSWMVPREWLADKSFDKVEAGAARARAMVDARR